MQKIQNLIKRTFLFCVSICSAQNKNRYISGMVLRKVGILTLSANSGIVPGNSRIAQGISWEYLDKMRIGKVAVLRNSKKD